ncbi:heme ABC transporter ATP-binding protein [Pseudoclavibacter sp. CFCC 13796]|uniref:heme ABC transporter ATP-binding protein n=1 Tax=Pseudoclavibacter sp. CFCC 13796 TaxID=2615179 RepID=UPI001301123E|nr:heme ABC transporter ATP-binding protein [Pseudoclavibacter sp. CFCC 13796]KAB1661208.1 heme ABC transporter ATP-binding protein [Pseudoclavibacter sp. CFCC 13796]
MSGLMSARMIALPKRTPIGETALEACDLSVELGGRTILDHVDAVVRAGEVLALVGPNGAGKSTLLGALSGDIPSTGVVRLDGRSLSEWPLSEQARARAVLTQHNSLAFPFTVLEVIEMGRAPWQRTPREVEDEAAVAEAMERTETSAFGARAFPSLSGGESARVSLARVLAQRTGVLLLDEPTAALDIRHQEEVLGIARERAQAGDAVVIVLHDLNLAAAYADRIALLEHGTVTAVGSPSEVLTTERISRVYRYPVDVIEHPHTGQPLVLPSRGGKASEHTREESA